MLAPTALLSTAKIAQRATSTTRSNVMITFRPGEAAYVAIAASSAFPNAAAMDEGRGPPVHQVGNECNR
jgi:hypothetical protein